MEESRVGVRLIRCTGTFSEMRRRFCRGSCCSLNQLFTEVLYLIAIPNAYFINILKFLFLCGVSTHNYLNM